jgi:peroxiredoxin
MTSYRDARRGLPPIASEPQAATLQIGAPAPMFSYLATDGQWHRFDEQLKSGAALILFAPSEAELSAVQRLYPVFQELGVTPVAILDLPTRGTSAVSRRLALDLPVLSDPMCAIAGLYHSVDPSNSRHAASYFVIDRKRVLRAMYFGPFPPAELLLASAARCLGKPLPPSVFSSGGDR